MSRLLLDTNHLSAAIRPNLAMADRIYEAIDQGHRVGTCIPVICEVEAGIQRSPKAPSLRRTLTTLLLRVRVWPVDLPLARRYGEVHAELRSRGRVLSHVDMVLAALARTMKLTLLTSDRDFEALPDISTENWLT